MAKILTHNRYINALIKEGRGIESGLYADQVDGENVTYKEPIHKNFINLKTNKEEPRQLRSVVVPHSVAWEGSEGHANIWNQLEYLRKKIGRKSNYNQFDETLYYQLIDLVRVDMTRRRMNYIDYTALMTSEITNEAYTKSINLTEFLPYTAWFAEFFGYNETAPLVEQKYGAKESVNLRFWHAGHTRSLLDEMFDTNIYTFQKVLEAIARGWTALRNSLCIGLLPTAGTETGTWHALQTIDFTDDPGLTFHEQNYAKYDEGLRVLMQLLDVQTRQEIPMSRVVAVVGSNARALDLQKITNGQLNGIGAKTQVLPRLAIDDIWIHKGDTIYWQGEKKVFPGINKDKAYLFIPGPSGSPIYTPVKRQLTQEIGAGNVLTHEREKRVWYGSQTTYNKEFYGSSNPDIITAIPDANTVGYGYAVVIDLPAEPDQHTAT